MIDHLTAIAAHAYYAGELEAGRRACERLLAMRDLPDGIEILTRRNRTWYAQRLDELVATNYVRIDVEPAAPGWSLFNPSVVALDGGFLVNVRSSNYRIFGGRYVMPDEDGGRIKTKNILTDYARDLTPVGRPTVMACDYQSSGYQVEGLEDVRLNVVGSEILASATVRDFAGLDGTCRIGTATATRHAGQYVGLEVYETADGIHEKNWMPVTGSRRWLYSCHVQGRVATATQEAGRWAIELGAESPALARGFRGGSQLVDIGSGLYLAVIHEVAHDKDGRRTYEHRFVAFDSEDWSISGVSRPFVFREARSIEFAAGLARTPGQLVVSFGVRDCEAWLVELRLTDVMPLLEPVA
jgi:predicted GH43/DUF377 family glycosyl hydrolase